MKKISLLVLLSTLIIFGFSSFADEMQLPSGWRNPQPDEILDNWRSKDSNKYLLIKGDFNGDGITDEAQLLIRTDGTGLGLFVFLGQKDRKYKHYLIDEMENQDSIHVMGIRKVAKGRYRTACGKGYWECEKDEPSEIYIRYDAIDYFKAESANSYFYWNSKSKTFKRVWISD